jgi:hypothetical protein
MKKAIQLITFDGYLYALIDDGSVWRHWPDKPWREVELPWAKEDPPMLTEARWIQERKPVECERRGLEKAAGL